MVFNRMRSKVRGECRGEEVESVDWRFLCLKDVWGRDFRGC